MDLKIPTILLLVINICNCLEDEPDPVSELDLSKFTGRWFNVSILLHCLKLKILCNSDLNC